MLMLFYTLTEVTVPFFPVLDNNVMPMLFYSNRAFLSCSRSSQSLSLSF